MAKTSSTPTPSYTCKEPGILVTSPCGRQWFVSFQAVANDYMTFLVQTDKATPQEAYVTVLKNLEFLLIWFYEQISYNWEDIELLGQLVTKSTLFKTQKALNRARGPASLAQFQELNLNPLPTTVNSL